jgi:hypothetical protein
MSKEPNLATLPILFGIILTIIAPSVGVWTINSAYGKVSNNVKNVNFEIFECTVQGNSTHEISGPCPDVGGESPAVNVDKSPETKSPETKSPETKVDTSPNNDLTEPKIKEDNFNKYDFNEIHLADPEIEVHKDQETKVLVPTLPDTSTPIDPFGPSG